MTTYDDNLANYKNTIGQLVNGELKVLTKDEQDLWQELIKTPMSDDEKKLYIEQRFRDALNTVMNRASNALGRALGDDQIWITRALNVLMSLVVLEKHPQLARYTDSSGYINITQEHLSNPDPQIVEHVLTIQAVLTMFLHEIDCPAKNIAMRALTFAGHPVEFSGIGQVGPNAFAQIPTKWGYIRVMKEKKS